MLNVMKTASQRSLFPVRLPPIFRVPPPDCSCLVSSADLTGFLMCILCSVGGARGMGRRRRSGECALAPALHKDAPHLLFELALSLWRVSHHLYSHTEVEAFIFKYINSFNDRIVSSASWMYFYFRIIFRCIWGVVSNFQFLFCVLGKAFCVLGSVGGCGITCVRHPHDAGIDIVSFFMNIERELFWNKYSMGFSKSYIVIMKVVS